MQEKYSIIGRLGSDAEERQGSGGSSFVRMSVAVKGYDNKTRQNITNWRTVLVFGRDAEFAKSLKKGAVIHAEGRLGVDQSSDGKVWVSCIASNITVCDYGPNNVRGGGGDSGPLQPAITYDEFSDNAPAQKRKVTPAESSVIDNFDGVEVPF